MDASALCAPFHAAGGGQSAGSTIAGCAIDPRCRVRFGNFYRDLIQLGFMWGFGAGDLDMGTMAGVICGLKGVSTY